MRSDDSVSPGASVATVVTTRLTPRHRDGYLERKTLINEVEQALLRRLTLVHAAAGYGKTSLLGQAMAALEARDIACAWLTLEDDSSASAFLVHLIMACVKSGYIDKNILSNIGVVDEKMSSQVLMAVFINAVAASATPLVVFLDEYNRSQSQETDDLVCVLIRNLPEHVHFVIASRWRPNIGIENLRAHDDLQEITANDLCFSVAEARSLLGSLIPDLDPQQVAGFVEYTQGWPIALQMLRMWLGSGTRQRDLMAFFADNRIQTARYLTEQVLSELPQDEQHFLFQTSILDRVNGDIANEITGRSDGWFVLEKLNERNLFLEPLESDRQWFRFHAVFLEYLRDLLSKRHPGSIQGLHEQAASWFESNGYLKQALYHARQVQNDALAARILSGAGGWRMVMDGRMGLIRDALEQLADVVVRQFPSLQLAQVLLLIKGGAIEDATAAFETLTTAAANGWSEQDLVDYKIVENTLQDYADAHVSIEDISAIEALRQQIPRQDHLLHALLSDSLAAKCYGMRFFERTLDACADALSRYRMLRSLYGEMFIRFKQVQVYLAQGRLEEADVMLLQNAREIELRLGHNTDLAAHNAVFLAELYLEQHKLDAASDCLAIALPLIEQSDGWFELYASAYSSAATIAWRNEGIDGVLATLDRAGAVAKSRHLDRLQLLMDAETTFYLCLNGQHNAVQRYIPLLATALEAECKPYHFVSGRVAVCLAIAYLSTGHPERAERLLEEHRLAAAQVDDRQRLIPLLLAAASVKHVRGDKQQAALLFDQAIQEGLFRGIRQAYISFTFWLSPLIKELMHDDRLLPADRYRTQFLAELKSDMKAWENSRLRAAGALTIAELEVLRQLDRGFTNKEIALQLGISPNTVKFRLKGIFARFGVSRRAELVRYVREHGVLPRREPEGPQPLGPD